MCEKEERSIKVDDFFFGLQLKLGQRFCRAKAETPLKNPGSATEIPSKV